MTNNSTHKNVKELREQRANVAAKLDRINDQIADLKIAAESAYKTIVSLDAEINRKVKVVPEPRLSDHALLRYIERFYNVDVEAIRAKIMTPTVIKAIKNGATAVTVEGARFKVVDNTVVTVYAPNEGNKAKTGKTVVDSLHEGLAEYYNDKATNHRG